MTKDLTSGNPFKLIISFSIPLFFSYLLQQVYNIVDTIIVGQYLGKESLAAVGSTSSVNFLVIGFVLGVCSGFAIPIANRFGAKDFTKLRHFVVNSLYLSGIISVIMALVTVIFCKPILRVMQTPENIIDNAAIYIGWIFAGIPFAFLYNLSSGIIRAFGDSKTPLFFLIISTVLNIVLDILFIITFGWGIAGAAIATVIAQGFSGILCTIVLFKKYDILQLSKDDKKLRTELFAPLCGSGFPMGFQYSITAVGNMLLQSAVNSLGSDVVACVSSASKIQLFLCCPFDALGTAMATWTGQNLGAQKVSRVKEGLFVTMIMTLIYSIVMSCVVFAFGNQFIKLFLDSSEITMIKDSHFYAKVVSLFYFPLAIVIIVRATIQGMGFSKIAIFAGVFEMSARTITAFLLVPTFGYVATAFASPLAWGMADIFLIITFCVCYKKLIKSSKKI